MNPLLSRSIFTFWEKNFGQNLSWSSTYTNVWMIPSVTNNKRSKKEGGRDRGWVKGERKEREREWRWSFLTLSLHALSLFRTNSLSLSLTPVALWASLSLLTGPDCSIVCFNLLVRPAVARLESQRATNYKNLLNRSYFCNGAAGLATVGSFKSRGSWPSPWGVCPF